ncbi:MAG: Ig-like domain-containing protein, partial [Clostridiales bacterium]|nr:Ig-like domain-containing protein [Clostridiales bacterium]
VYVTPQTDSWEYIYFDYDSTEGLYTGTLDVTDNLESGEWYVRLIRAIDTSGNSITYDGVNSLYGTNADLSAASFTISGTNADITSPTIDTSTLKADNTSYTVGDTVTVTVEAEDNVGIDRIFAVYVTPQTDSWEYIYFDYDSTEGLYTGTLDVTDSLESGEWYVRLIRAIDTSGNSMTYDGVSALYGTYADLSAASFTISEDTEEEDNKGNAGEGNESTSKDKQNIIVSISSDCIYVGDSVTIEVSGAEGTLNYSSSDMDVATVDDNGVITGISSGTATITIIAAETDNYEAATKTVEITVEEDTRDWDTVCLGKSTSVTLSSASDQTYTFTSADGAAVSAVLTGQSTSVISVGGISRGTYSKTYSVTMTAIGKHVLNITGSSGSVTEYYLEVVDHEYTESLVEATCEEDGYIEYICTRCGDSYRDDIIYEALGHDYISETTEPTCTNDGYITYTCSRCGDCYTEGIEALGHDYISEITESTCTKAGFTTYTCIVCGDSYTDDEVAALGHSWDDGVIADDVITYTCTECGETKMENLAHENNILDGSIVISTDQILTDTIINGDLYIQKGAILTTSGTVIVNGNVYVYGTLDNTGTLTVSDSLYCLHYGSLLSAGDYDYGYLNNIGSVNITNLIVKADYLSNEIPDVESDDSNQNDDDNNDSGSGDTDEGTGNTGNENDGSESADTDTETGSEDDSNTSGNTGSSDTTGNTGSSAIASSGNTSAAASSPDTLAVRRGNLYYFSYSLKSGNADKTVAYGKATDEVLIGDWDGDGVDTICVRRGNTYYFKNTITGGNADIVIAYGKTTDEVLVGDWNGDGKDTLAVRRGNTYYFSNSLKSGNADKVIAYGKTTDTVLVGDWDGDGKDTLAVRRGNAYYISNTIHSGTADKTVYYGKATDTVLVGDWDGNNTDTLTVRRGNLYYISNTIKSGNADKVIAYGKATDDVYAGTWK